jgi:hypothetical protein
VGEAGATDGSDVGAWPQQEVEGEGADSVGPTCQREGERKGRGARGPLLAGLGWHGLGRPSSVGTFIFFVLFLFSFFPFLFYFITFDSQLRITSNLFLKICKNKRVVLVLD